MRIENWRMTRSGRSAMRTMRKTIPPFIVFGAGGHAKVVLDAARSAGMAVQWIVETRPKAGELLGVRVVGEEDVKWRRWRGFKFIVAIGDNVVRKRIFTRLIELGGEPVNIVHASAVVSRTAKLGWGISVCAGSVIGVLATIGNNCIINTCASVDHDGRIGNDVHLAPGVRLAGNVEIGDGTLVGMGTTVLPGNAIGAGCIIGAGSVVNRELPNGIVAYGVPARIRRRVKAGNV